MKLWRTLRQNEFWIPLRTGAISISLRHWPLLIIWVLLIAFAYQTQRDIFFRLAYLIFALVIFSFFWALYGVATFELKRQVITPRTQVGQVAEERFFVRNTGAFPKVWLEVRDESELPNHHVSRVLSGLRAHAGWSWSVRTVCRRRGRFYFGPITIASGDPFGIFIVRRRLPGTTATITVHPATVDLATFALPMGHLPGGEQVHRRTHHTTTNVSGTRDYAPGDSFNRIHWRSTARMDRLIVKEFELDPAADVWMFCDMERAVQAAQWWDDKWDSGDLSDLWFAGHELRLPPATEEYVVTITASIAKYFLRRQRSVGLVTYGNRREVIQPDRGERQLNRLLEVLSVLRSDGNTPFDHVIGVESARLARNVTLVAVTPSTDLAWIRAAREAKRRGLRVITAFVDANTFGAKRETEGTAAELIASGIPTYVVSEGADLQTTLSR